MQYNVLVKRLARGGLLVLPVLFVFAVAMLGNPKPALACGVCDSMLNAEEDQILQDYLDAAHAETQAIVNAHTDEEFELHQEWLIEVYFRQYILPAMMLMTEQMSAVAMQQMEILGVFLDAKHQMETNRLYQQLAAQAHKDYHPSEGMCTIGTAARSLAAADRQGELTALTLSQRALDRQLMNVNSVGSEGRMSDRVSRADQFRNRYCDRNDNHGGLAGLCAANVPADRKNKDIDFNRTLWGPLSLNVNFSDANLTQDEEDIMALEANLYSHNTFTSPIPQSVLEGKEGNQQVYLDMRSVIAKRSVAENTFQSIAAMKSQGTTAGSGTAQYLRAAMRELNPAMTDAEAAQLIGENPSYYAQMEILTKKIVENPQFFTDLYDKPANVARKGVALQAIGLMQARDTFKSNLRSESIMSVLLEMEVIKAQKAVQDEINRLGGR